MTDSFPERIGEHEQQKNGATATADWLIPALALLGICLMYPGFLILQTAWNFRCFTPETLGLVCAGLLCLRPRLLLERLSVLPGSVLLAAGLLFGIGAWHFIMAPNASYEQFGSGLIYLTLPLLAFVYAERFLSLLPWYLGGFWIWNLLFGILLRLRVGEFAGLPGNRNWNAALIAATAPFACYGIYLLLRKKGGLPRRWAAAGASPVIVISLWMLSEIASRGNLAALMVTALLGGLLLLKGKWRRTGFCVTGILLALAIACGVLFFSGGLAAAAAESERGIIGLATLDMILAKPVFGYGTFAFEQEYASSWRPLSYFFHPHCAVRTDHPHNHLLFMAAGFGLAGLAAWCFLLLFPLIRWIRKYDEDSSPVRRMCLFSLVLLLTHSLFDLILERTPTNALALLFLGIAWDSAWKVPLRSEESAVRRDPLPDDPESSAEGGAVLKNGCRVRRILFLLCGGLILGLALFSVCRTAWTEVLLFRGRQVRSLSGDEASAAEYYRRAGLASFDPQVIYQSMARAMNGWRDDRAVLIFADRIAGKTVIPDYVHTNAYAAAALMNTGDYAKAQERMKREIALYPLQLLPRLRLAGLYRMTGRIPEAGKIESDVKELMRLRGIDGGIFREILKNPDYDLRPWDAPGWRNPQGGPFPPFSPEGDLRTPVQDRDQQEKPTRPQGGGQLPQSGTAQEMPPG